MTAVYRFEARDDGAPKGLSSLHCRLSLDGPRFRLAVIAIGRNEQPGWAARREEWDYTGEWSRREGELVFRPATCVCRDWPELEVVSVEVAMMDQPYYLEHPIRGDFFARVLDGPSFGADIPPTRLLLPVPREMAELSSLQYGEVVLVKE